MASKDTVKLLSVDSPSIKNNLLMIALNNFYSKNENLDRFIEIISNNSVKMSLRIIDWFVTNYSKKNYIIYYIPKKRLSCKKTLNPKNTTPVNIPGKINKLKTLDTCPKTEQFIVYLRYKSQLKAYSKKKFDPFCRNDRITGWGPNKDIVTTIGQLNFFRWAIENNVIEHISENLKEIEDDMNKNIRKHYTSKKSKKSSLKKDIEKSNQGKSYKKKRRELSTCATKTLNKHKVNITLDFD